MSRLVLDCSVTLSWCFEDEHGAYSAEILHTLSSPGTRAVVPSIWPLEVANVLLNQERRGRVGRAEVSAFLKRLSRYPIDIEIQPTETIWGDVLSLARTHALTSYDAAYLELALRLKVPLATFDRELIHAARRAKLPLVQ
ncbi:MAG: tRNA(fMet)-specific endonuclease VapC [bacterium]|nr:tRNA(fMet)-specific endonuclease VapC [bacterium]